MTMEEISYIYRSIAALISISIVKKQNGLSKFLDLSLSDDHGVYGSALAWIENVFFTLQSDLLKNRDNNAWNNYMAKKLATGLHM